MKLNVVGPHRANWPFATEIAFISGLESLGHIVYAFDPNVETVDVLARDADVTLVFKNSLSYDRDVFELGPKIVLYQPDDLRFPHIRHMVSEMRQYTEHLITFRDYSADGPVKLFIDSLNLKTVNVLPVTAHPLVYRSTGEPKDADFCFVGSIGDSEAHRHRHTMVELLRNEGFSVIFGQTRDINQILSAISRSRVVLNHASDNGLPFGYGYGYQCRHFEVGFAGGCLLSNTVIDNDSTNPLLSSFFTFDGTDSFVRQAHMLMDMDDAQRAKCGGMLFDEVMTYHSPAVRANQLINILERIL